MVLEVFIHIHGVEVFGIETGEQYIDHNHHVDFVVVRVIGLGVFLVLNALLYILVIQIEFVNAVIGFVLGVVGGNDVFKRDFLFFGRLFVIDLFLL